MNERIQIMARILTDFSLRERMSGDAGEQVERHSPLCMASRYEAAYRVVSDRTLRRPWPGAPSIESSEKQRAILESEPEPLASGMCTISGRRLNSSVDGLSRA